MHASSHTIWRKISASLILALFVFIHSAKVFHKHQQDTDLTEQKMFVVKPVNASCTICDFQVAKDAELPLLAITTISPISWQKEYAVISLVYHYVPIIQIFDRGPPAI